eukprot:GHVU01227612.1.p1 GENE.GHVU01227612.1~~GHVU01227612.1.p1  ORF type:complete len:228 (-),score=15.61 GHVU01227612.1:50-733(-)
MTSDDSKQFRRRNGFSTFQPLEHSKQQQQQEHTSGYVCMWLHVHACVCAYVCTRAAQQLSGIGEELNTHTHTHTLSHAYVRHRCSHPSAYLSSRHAHINSSMHPSIHPSIHIFRRWKNPSFRPVPPWRPHYALSAPLHLSPHLSMCPSVDDQVAKEGSLTCDYLRAQLEKGVGATGDFIPSTLAQTYTNEDFGSLPGRGRIRRRSLFGGASGASRRAPVTARDGIRE